MNDNEIPEDENQVEAAYLETVQCNICWKEFRGFQSAEQLLQHQLQGDCTSTKVRCRKCGTLYAIEESHVDNCDGLFHCEHCDERFATLFERQSHMDDVFETDQACPKNCGEVFETIAFETKVQMKGVYIKHVRACTGPHGLVTTYENAHTGPHGLVEKKKKSNLMRMLVPKCDVCGREFYGDQAEEHLEKHAEEGDCLEAPTKCDYCAKEFVGANRIKQANWHGKRGKCVDLPVAQECEKCGKVFELARYKSRQCFDITAYTHQVRCQGPKAKPVSFWRENVILF